MRRASMFALAFAIAQMIGLFGDGDTSAPKPVLLSQDAHFRMLMENTRVRVWMMELRPDDKTNLVSRDYDFLQVPLDEGWMSTSIEGRQAIPFWVEKRARFVRRGFAQTVQNTNKTPVRVIEVEFIKSIGVEQCGPEAQVSCGCWGGIGGIITMVGCRVLETDYVAINQLETHPGEKLGLLVVPALVVSIDRVNIQPTASSGDTGLILKPGGVLWLDKPAQTIEGVEPHATARAVTVEFKSPYAGLSDSR